MYPLLCSFCGKLLMREYAFGFSPPVFEQLALQFGYVRWFAVLHRQETSQAGACHVRKKVFDELGHFPRKLNLCELLKANLLTLENLIRRLRKQSQVLTHLVALEPLVLDSWKAWIRMCVRLLSGPEHHWRMVCTKRLLAFFYIFGSHLSHFTLLQFAKCLLPIDY
jgi:hypothetical protein